MKKLTLLCLLAFSTALFFNACKDEEKNEPKTPTAKTENLNSPSTSTDAVVVINGVKWATCNVAAPGNFTIKPEDAGMFYQWNSKVGWPATGAIGSITATDGNTTWNSSWNGGYATPSASDTWTSANDPSPIGYRVPTLTEIKTLFDTTKVSNTWITQNSATGCKFTDKTTGNSLFLPASSYRGNTDGALGTGSYGHYWGGTANDGRCAYHLLFSSGFASWRYYNRAYGFAVRPVAE